MTSTAAPIRPSVTPPSSAACPTRSLRRASMRRSISKADRPRRREPNSPIGTVTSSASIASGGRRRFLDSCRSTVLVSTRGAPAPTSRGRGAAGAGTATSPSVRRFITRTPSRSVTSRVWTMWRWRSTESMKVRVSCSSETAVNRSPPERSAPRSIWPARSRASWRVSSRTRSSSRCDRDRKMSQEKRAMSQRTKSPNRAARTQKRRERGRPDPETIRVKIALPPPSPAQTIPNVHFAKYDRLVLRFIALSGNDSRSLSVYR